MPEIGEFIVGAFTGIGHAIGTITAVEIKSKLFQNISWILKVIAQIVEIVLGAVFLGTEIGPNMPTIGRTSAHLRDPQGYKIAADAYIAFFVLEIILDVALWITLIKFKGPRKYSAAISVLFAIAFEMPIMMCSLFLMRAKGTIDWDKQAFELLFHIWYIVNIMLQITAGFAEKVRYWGVIILAPASYVFACLPYAFVIIPMSGWHWFRSASEYFEDSHKFVHGTFTSTHIHNMFDFLIVSGLVGQWIWNILLVICLIILLGSGANEDKKKKEKRKRKGQSENTV